MEIVIKIENFDCFTLIKVPDLPGFAARSGKNRTEARRDLEDQIEAHIKRLRRVGLELEPFRSLQEVEQRERWGVGGGAVSFEVVEIDVPAVSGNAIVGHA